MNEYVQELTNLLPNEALETEDHVEVSLQPKANNAHPHLKSLRRRFYKDNTLFVNKLLYIYRI